MTTSNNTENNADQLTEQFGAYFRRYFAVSCLLLTVIAAVGLCLLFRYAAVDKLMAYGKQSSIMLSRTLSNSVWPQFERFLPAASTMDNLTLRTHSETARINELVLAQVAEIPVLKVKLFDLEGRTVFSTDPNQLAEVTPLTYGGNIAAQTGQILTDLSFRDKFTGLHGNVEKRYVFSAYLPVIHSAGATQRSVGVLGTYLDVTPLIEDIERTQGIVFLSVVLIFSLVYAALHQLIRHFERKLAFETQASANYLKQLKESNQRLQSASEDAQSARDEAMRANKAKSTFLANMSHELRTPLNAVIGYSEILLDELDPLVLASNSTDVHKIHAAGRHLLALINNILDISKIEAGRMEIHVESFSIGDVVRDIANGVEPLLRQNKNKLMLNLEPQAGTMSSDLTKVRQIFFNLIGNAIKFTNGGVITVSLTRHTIDDRDWITFSVADTGIGMTTEEQGRAFSPFFQGDDSTTRRYGGTGLGLAITRQLTELLGGRIEFRSGKGLGSTFVVHLPVKSVPRASIVALSNWTNVGPKVDAAAVRFHKLAPGAERRERVSTVLSIDDDASVRDLMERFLTRQGFFAYTAANALEGLELARQIMPDVITLDVMMPEKDGWWVLGQLKRDPDLASIPVVMLTMVENKELGYALGAADFLTKPVDQRMLHDTIVKNIRDPSTAVALLVQPDSEQQRLLKGLLQSQGLRVVVADSVDQAIQTLERTVPELIVTELIMPKFDGVTFIDMVRNHEKWKNIPVVATSSELLDRTETTALTQSIETVLYTRKKGQEEFFDEFKGMIVKYLRQSPSNRFAISDSQSTGEAVETET